jgi:transposase
MERRRRYSQEFKRGAVEQTRIAGVTLRQVADELGVNPRLLSCWRQPYLKEGSKAFPGKGWPRDEEWRR